MLKKLVLACVIIMLIPGVISMYDHVKLIDYKQIPHYLYEYPNTDFRHNGEIINSQAIHYIHTRLDQRLAYEDKFKNNIQLSDYESSSEDKMPYNTIAEVKDYIFLIQTSFQWMWGDYRHSIFLIEKNNGTLNLLDYFIPDSINDPMEYYKVNDHGVTILSGDEKIDLYFNSSKF